MQLINYCQPPPAFPVGAGVEELLIGEPGPEVVAVAKVCCLPLLLSMKSLLLSNGCLAPLELV
jgi:hypothetical protein